MELDSETQGNKSYTALTNVNLDTHNNHQFKFEKFILSGNSDSEEDNEEHLICSDDSRSEEEISNFEYSIQDLSSQNFSLTTEDWSTINSSVHPELRKTLIMNRNVKYMTLQLFNKVKTLLVKNQEKIKTLKKSLETNKSKECNMMFLGQLGATYFKTKKHMFCCSPNKDTLDRRNRGLLTIYESMMSSKWSKSECDKLTRGVQLTYNHNKQKAVLKEISALKLKLDKEDEDSEICSEITHKIEQLKVEIKNLKAIGVEDIPPLSQDKFLDWEYISTEFLMDKHNAQECSSFWHLYLHPDINKSNWTSEENMKIRLLAEKYKKQEWDRIAVELGTNRTGFSVFLYYSSTLCDQMPKSRFTEDEDRQLLQHVESRKIGSYIPWNMIAESFPTRTKMQLMHRYKYYLTNLDQYTQEFSDAEDILIMLLVQRFGRNYMKFTKYLPNKSYMQIKSRYDNHLRFSRIKGCFTLEDDEKILAHFNGMNDGINTLTVALNRNRIQIRQRYRILKDFFDKNPDKLLKNLPRRCGKKNETFRRLEFLKCVGDQFKECVDVPTIDEIEKKLGKKKNDHDVDILLVNFFSTSYTLKQKSLEITSAKIAIAADKIYNIFKHWRVNLIIPTEIKKNNMFDIIDLEILDLLRHKYHSGIYTPSIDDLLPPNMNSLIGLRGLLLKNQIFKKSILKRNTTLKDNIPTKNDDDTHIAYELLNIFHNKDISTQCRIQNERSLFLERFVSLFMWPSLLSIKSPIEKTSRLKLKNTEQPTNNINNKEQFKKKSLKRNLEGNSNMLVAKKSKLSDAKQKNKCNTHDAMQPQRFSSRLKHKKEISNETIEVEQKCSDVEKIDNKTDFNQSNPILNNKSYGIAETMKSTNVKIYGNTKINHDNFKETNPQNLLPNLVKVDKSEIVKLLQGKKPIKIIKIQSIKGPEGTIAVNNPTNIKINKRVENMDKSITPAYSSGISFVENLKNKFKAKFSPVSKNIDLDNTKVNYSKEIKKNLDKENTKGISIPHRNDGINSTKSANRFSESSIKSAVPNHTEDLNKLDAFLKNVGDEDSSINLCENEVMKNEVEQLDRLINQESAFNVTSI